MVQVSLNGYVLIYEYVYTCIYLVYTNLLIPWKWLSRIRKYVQCIPIYGFVWAIYIWIKHTQGGLLNGAGRVNIKLFCGKSPRRLNYKWRHVWWETSNYKWMILHGLIIYKYGMDSSSINGMIWIFNGSSIHGMGNPSINGMIKSTFELKIT